MPNVKPSHLILAQFIRLLECSSYTLLSTYHKVRVLASTMAVTAEVLVVFVSVPEANAGSFLQISAYRPVILAASVYLSLYGKIPALYLKLGNDCLTHPLQFISH